MRIANILPLLAGILPLACSAQETYSSNLTWQLSSTFVITKFQATITIPTQPSGGNESQLFWAGLKPNNITQGIEGVVTTLKPAERGDIESRECCSPEQSVVNPLLYLDPGDELTSTFESDPKSKMWQINWNVKRGPLAIVIPTPPGYGGVPKEGISGLGLVSQASLAVNIAPGGEWNFGTIIWKDIVITSTASDTLWCFFSIPHNVTVNYVGTRTARTKNGYTTCNIPQIDFISPEW